MKCLVIGLGSVGSRHVRILENLGCTVAVVTRRPTVFPTAFSDIAEAIRLWQPQYIIIASRTNEHLGDLRAVAQCGFVGKVLIEKPIFDKFIEVPRLQFEAVAVAYNLRFNPLIRHLQAFLANQSRLISAHVYVGQYLPQWRPLGDYRSSYSARAREGGGALLDLSHEIDYSQWLLGPWTALTAKGGHFSSLEIDSDDTFSILMVTHRCPIVTINMNYIDRNARRTILIHTDEHSVLVDLVRGTFEVDGCLEYSVSVERDSSYRSEHRAILTGDLSIVCSVPEALDVLTTIDAAKTAARTEQWITR